MVDQTPQDGPRGLRLIWDTAVGLISLAFLAVVGIGILIGALAFLSSIF